MCREKKWLLSGLLFVAIILILTLWINQIQAQEKYPTRAIDIIVPFSPGGSVDLTARLEAGYLNKKWGVPVNVINKPGGNTVPACLEVYRAAPDGYTIFGDSQPSASLLEVAVKNLPFKIMDRTLVAITTSAPMTMAVSSNSPYTTLEDVAAEARKNPGDFTWTSIGGASSLDALARLFFKAIGVDVRKTKPVICQGASQAIALAAGGHVKIGIGSTSSALPAFRSKTIRVVTISSSKRDPDFPEVPTAAEAGYPGMTFNNWMGISGPPKLPSHIVDKWERAMEEMLKDPEVIPKMRNIGLNAFYKNAHEAKEHIIKEIEEFKELWGLK